MLFSTDNCCNHQEQDSGRHTTYSVILPSHALKIRRQQPSITVKNYPKRMSGGTQNHVMGTCQPLPHRADLAPRPNKAARTSYEVLFASSCYFSSSRAMPSFSQSMIPNVPILQPEEAKLWPRLQLFNRQLTHGSKSCIIGVERKGSEPLMLPSLAPAGLRNGLCFLYLILAHAPISLLLHLLSLSFW